MTYSEIKITFNEDLEVGSKLQFKINTPASTLGLFIFENWVNFRSASRQVTTGVPTTIIGERAAINFARSFNLDYNSTGVYLVSRTNNEVVIKSTNSQISFSSGQVTIDTQCNRYDLYADGGTSVTYIYPDCNGNQSQITILNGDNATVCASSIPLTDDIGGTIIPVGICSHEPTPLNVEFQYNNFTGTLFEINSIELEQATYPCTHIKVKVTTSELASKIISPISIDSNTENPFYFEVLRDGSVKIICENATNQTALQKVFLPKILSAGNFEIQVNNSPNGATVIIKDNTPDTFGTPLNLQYSLDNSTWQTSNVFNGLSADNYTVYIKDNYGCSITKSFVVDDFGIQEPYFYISKSNSMRFAKRVDWTNCDNLKNDENTLSCEANVKIPYKEVQQFQSCDVITTQFKSNYTNIFAKVLDPETPLVIEQKTNNMRLKDKRDARKYNYGNGKTGVFFLNGKLYDFDTGVYTGNDYTLNGALPEWAIIGNYVEIDNAWFEIENIVFDEDKNAEVLIIDSVYLGVDTIIQIGCLYNRFNYEIFEFTMNMNDFNNKNIHVEITCNDGAFETITYLSEQINVKDTQENTVEIIYKNDTNTDVFYATGIEHKLRIPINKVNSKIEDNSETYKTDATAILLSAELFEANEFVFEPVTKGIMIKITQALSHRLVFIDRIQYVKNSSIEVEGALEDTNLYNVKAVMVKANNEYTNQLSDTASAISDINIEIPRLLAAEGDFVKY